MPKGTRAERARRLGRFIIDTLKQPLYEQADEQLNQRMEAEAIEREAIEAQAIKEREDIDDSTAKEAGSDGEAKKASDGKQADPAGSQAGDSISPEVR